MFKLLIVCAGPSPERDISLNSARSIYDNLGSGAEVETQIVFVDQQCGKHLVSGGFLYSNTTSDFDFKLETEGQRLSEEEFLAFLKKSDLVFPAIHGVYGEDGELQAFFEKNAIAFTGSGSCACAMMYNKENAETQILQKHGFKTVPKLFLKAEERDLEGKVAKFFKENNLKDVVVKPCQGGSSIGVTYAKGTEQATAQAQNLLQSYNDVVVEAKCAGSEFTVIIFQGPGGDPIALVPTEITVVGQSADDTIFNKRRKYLATTETHYYCPPRFDRETIEKIRKEAETLFKLTGAKDFLRIDGWVLPGGEIYFSDFNPISGMEQNSFMFQQASRVGMTHGQVLKLILRNACRRYMKKMPEEYEIFLEKEPVYVLFGGVSSERQVSLMSGSNVWMKLMHSQKYAPAPFILVEQKGELCVLQPPYAMALNHTVEEIVYQWKNAQDLPLQRELAGKIRGRLGLSDEEACNMNEASLLTLSQFISKAKEEGAYVFLGLHGGLGENGEIQALLEEADVPFNGSGAEASRLCMDKYETGELVDSLGVPLLRAGRKVKITRDELGALVERGECEEFWRETSKQLGKKVVAKPMCDGCSTGVVILDGPSAFEQYAEFLASGARSVPEGVFFGQAEHIALPVHSQDFLLEEFTKTDKIFIRDGQIFRDETTGWLELTVGVTERGGRFRAFLPSITVAQAGVLSVEEKFQGGTGVNITPPPEGLVPGTLVQKIRANVEAVAAAAGVRDYCRVDIFANTNTNEVIIIEINTLPGLSPSTVLFQQAAKETPAFMPREFLESIVANGGKKI